MSETRLLIKQIVLDAFVAKPNKLIYRLDWWDNFDLKLYNKILQAKNKN